MYCSHGAAAMRLWAIQPNDEPGSQPKLVNWPWSSCSVPALAFLEIISSRQGCRGEGALADTDLTLCGIVRRLLLFSFFGWLVGWLVELS